MRRSWPHHDLDLLLKVALLPDAEAAQCWDRWKAHHDLDDVTWEEHKLLAPIASRLPAIAPNCPYRPRVQGLAKAHWTNSQLMMRDSAVALDTLIANSIPVMLLKGGALQAAGFGGSGPRISGDLDILVPRSLYPRAVAALYADGWSSRDSSEYAQSSWRFRAGLNLRRGLHGDIDVHHQPIPYPNVADAVLDALWARAKPARFLGRSIVIPSPADMIVMTAAHAVRPATTRQISAAWAFDLVALLKKEGFDVEQVAESAAAFGTKAACATCLTYLDRLVPLDSTKRIIRLLEHRPLAIRETLGIYAGTRNSRYTAPLRQLAGFIAGDQPNRFEHERRVVPRLRRLRLPVSASAVSTSDASLLDQKLRHEFDVDGAAGHSQRRLIIELEFDRPPVARRFRFDMSIDGLPVGRLGARPRKQTRSARLTFSVPLPPLIAPAIHVAVEALPEGKLPAKANLEQVLRAKPIPFRIARVSLR